MLLVTILEDLFESHKYFLCKTFLDMSEFNVKKIQKPKKRKGRIMHAQSGPRKV
jgi:hypothetical protein